MFKLTNDQRKCFALVPIHDQWECIEAKPSPYDQFKTYLYLDGDTIVKCILSGDSQYCEYELSEKVSSDRKYLLPKTTKGKTTLLSSSTILKRNGIGMRLNYNDKNIHLYNEKTECSYFFNSYLNDDVCDLDGFSRWVENWCKETTDADIADVVHFFNKSADTFGIKKAMYSASRSAVGYMATEEFFLIMTRCERTGNLSGISL